MSLSITSFRSWFEDRNLATIMLVFMSIQLIAFEGMDISLPKVIMMTIMPLVFITKVPYMSKAVMYGLIFLLVTLLELFQHKILFIHIRLSFSNNICRLL